MKFIHQRPGVYAKIGTQPGFRVWFDERQLRRVGYFVKVKVGSRSAKWTTCIIRSIEPLRLDLM